MNTQSIKMTLAGFIGGVAFIIGCGGGGGGSATNSAVANTTAQVQDIEEMYCRISQDGVSNSTGYLSNSVNYYYEGGSSLANTQTYSESYPNHVIYCATLGASSYTQYTLASLQQGGWKTYTGSGSGSQSKVWRAVLR